jgi:natural product precursor
MKIKKLTKKLALNKKTVANLDSREMKSLKGGVEYTVYNTNCDTCNDLSVVYCITAYYPCPTEIPIICLETHNPEFCV